MNRAAIYKPKLAPEAGFTLLETVLALGLSALVLLAAFEVFSSYTNKFKQMNDTIENAADIEAGQQIVLKDLKAMSPSYTALNILDDQGKPFFDYFPDVPEKSFPGDPTCDNRPCRTYTMKANQLDSSKNGFSEIVLLLEDSLPCDVPSMVYDPSAAFQIFSNTATPYVDAPAPVFKGLDNGAAVSGINGRPGNSAICGKQGNNGRLGFWNFGWINDDPQLLMLDSPSYFRPLGVAMGSVAPRSPFFIGQVPKGGNLLKPLDTIDPVNLLAMKKWGAPQQTIPVLNTKHPLDATRTIDSEEHFLEWLPSFGGGQPLVRLRPVKLVRYSVELMYPTLDPTMAKAEQEKRRNSLRLWKQVYYAGKQWNGTGAQLVKKVLLAENVKTVQFRRPTITDKALYFNITKNELKKGGE